MSAPSIVFPPWVSPTCPYPFAFPLDCDRPPPPIEAEAAQPQPEKYEPVDRETLKAPIAGVYEAEAAALAVRLSPSPFVGSVDFLPPVRLPALTAAAQRPTHTKANAVKIAIKGAKQAAMEEVAKYLDLPLITPSTVFSCSPAFSTGSLAESDLVNEYNKYFKTNEKQLAQSGFVMAAVPFAIQSPLFPLDYLFEFSSSPLAAAPLAAFVAEEQEKYNLFMEESAPLAFSPLIDELFNISGGSFLGTYPPPPPAVRTLTVAAGPQLAWTIREAIGNAHHTVKPQIVTEFHVEDEDAVGPAVARVEEFPALDDSADAAAAADEAHEVRVSTVWGAFDQYDPIDLIDHGVINKGLEEFALTYLGRLYLFSSHANLLSFQSDPMRLLAKPPALPAAMILLVVGGPAVGKSTTARLFHQRLGFRSVDWAALRRGSDEFAFQAADLSGRVIIEGAPENGDVMEDFLTRLDEQGLRLHRIIHVALEEIESLPNRLKAAGMNSINYSLAGSDKDKKRKQTYAEQGTNPAVDETLESEFHEELLDRAFEFHDLIWPSLLSVCRSHGVDGVVADGAADAEENHEKLRRAIDPFYNKQKLMEPALVKDNRPLSCVELLGCRFCPVCFVELSLYVPIAAGCAVSVGASAYACCSDACVQRFMSGPQRFLSVLPFASPSSTAYQSPVPATKFPAPRFLVYGPTASGKSAACEALKKKYPDANVFNLSSGLLERLKSLGALLKEVRLSQAQAQAQEGEADGQAEDEAPKWGDREHALIATLLASTTLDEALLTELLDSEVFVHAQLVELLADLMRSHLAATGFIMECDITIPAVLNSLHQLFTAPVHRLLLPGVFVPVSIEGPRASQRLARRLADKARSGGNGDAKAAQGGAAQAAASEEDKEKAAEKERRKAEKAQGRSNRKRKEKRIRKESVAAPSFDDNFSDNGEDPAQAWRDELRSNSNDDTQSIISPRGDQTSRDGFSATSSSLIASAAPSSQSAAAPAQSARGARSQTTEDFSSQGLEWFKQSSEACDSFTQALKASGFLVLDAPAVRGDVALRALAASVDAALAPLMKAQHSLFHPASLIAFATACSLVSSGSRALRDFGSYCPVCMRDQRYRLVHTQTQAQAEGAQEGQAIMWGENIIFACSPDHASAFIEAPVLSLPAFVPANAPATIRVALYSHSSTAEKREKLGRLLAEEYELAYYSCASLIEQFLHDSPHTQLRASVLDYLTRGLALPDDLLAQAAAFVWANGAARVHGVVLDNFPANEAQAQRLREIGWPVDRVIEIEGQSNEGVEARQANARALVADWAKRTGECALTDEDVDALMATASSAPAPANTSLMSYYRTDCLAHHGLAASSSLWACSDAAREIVNKLRAGQIANENADKSQPINAADRRLRVSDLMRAAGACEDYCPVCWQNGEFARHALDSLQHVCLFHDRAYFLCSPAHYTQFSVNPQPFLTASLGGLPDRPLRATAALQAAAARGHAELLGWCPVSVWEYFQGLAPSVERGLSSLSVLYCGRLYWLSNAARLRQFERAPKKFADLTLPQKLPAEEEEKKDNKDTALLTRLEPEFQAFLSGPLARLASVRGGLKFPGLSVASSARLFLSLELSAANPAAPEWKRERARAALARFVDAAGLVAALAPAVAGDSAEAGGDPALAPKLAAYDEIRADPITSIKKIKQIE